MDFRQILKAIYKRHDTIAPLIEGLEGEFPQQTLDDYYVKLKTILKEDDDKKQGNYETISGQKQEVEMENIFSDPSIRRLLILGGAGVGKSTLMQYIAYRWSTSGLWNDKFDYVYRVPLKILLNTGWEHSYDINQRQDELKCLIHHSLVSQGAGEGCKLEDMPWLEKKEKILLLLDGYDEVAHERNGTFKGLFESIFKHENIILTSRPNAIDKQMAEKFGKKIENTGLDDDGINKYLNQYFKNDQEKGEALQGFLDKNSSIKEICHIPVNIAMLCFIWSEGDSNSALHEISNMSDLYKQVVDHLGFRYYAKSNPKQNQDELISQWKGGEIHLDELQMLEYTAFKAMTGGGIQIPNNQRVETLIIKGMTKKGDKQGISLQSSINYLAEKLSKSMPTINRVYKYGLLKPEGAMIDNSPQKKTKREPSETDLQEQSFSFIHLSFQEFLTAFYFVKNLLKPNNKEEQENIANFIAQHRNEPRYLMTLKLMAGLLSTSDEQGEQGIKIFWDAVMCNPDGVLELGVEAKVTLLMHLLGQARKDDTIDERIPNLKTAVDLIDSVVLQDLASWSSQIKESDYISENIKEGLIQFFLNDNKNWMSETSSRLQAKQTKKASPLTLEAVMEIISLLITKFSQDERDQIHIKVLQLIKNDNGTTWQLTKKALETLLTMHQKSKLGLDDSQKKDLLDAFLFIAYDSKLTQLSFKAMQEILSIKENPSFIERIKVHILQDEGGDFSTEDIIETKEKMLNLIATPLQFIKDVINTSFAPFLQDSVPEVQVDASRAITNIVLNTVADNQLILDTISLLISFRKEMHSDQISLDVRKLMEKGDHKTTQQLIRDHVKNLTPLIFENIHDCNKIMITTRRINHLIMLHTGNIDIELVSDVTENLFKALEKVTKYNLDRPVQSHIFFFESGCKKDPQFAKNFFKILISASKRENSVFSSFVSKGIRDIIQRNFQNDLQFLNDLTSILTPLLQHDKTNEQRISSILIMSMSTAPKIAPQFIQQAIDLFSPFMQNPDQEIRKRFTNYIIKLVGTNIQLAKYVINKMAPLLKHENHDIKKETLSNIQNTIEKSEKDPQFIQDLIMNHFIPALQNPAWEIKDSAVTNIAKLMGDSNTLIKSVVPAFIPLLQGPQSQLKKSVSDSFIKIIKTSKDVQPLLQEIINALIPLLKDSDDSVRNSAILSITGLVEIESSGDIQLRREVLNELIPLFQDPVDNLRVSAARQISKLFTSDLPFSRDLIHFLTSFLEPSHPFGVRRPTVDNLIQIVEKNKQLSREVLNIFIPLPKDPLDPRIHDACYAIGKLAKVSLNTDPQIAREIITILSPICKGSDSDLKLSVVLDFRSYISETNDEQFLREIVNYLAPALQDSEGRVKEMTCTVLLEAVKKMKNPDDPFIRSILEMFAPLFQDPQSSVKKEVSRHVVDLMNFADKNNTQLLKDAFDLMISLLKDSQLIDHTPKYVASFVEKIAPQLSQIAIEALIPHLQVGPVDVRNWTAESIAQLTLFLRHFQKKNLPNFSENKVLEPFLKNWTCVQLTNKKIDMREIFLEKKLTFFLGSFSLVFHGSV